MSFLDIDSLSSLSLSLSHSPIHTNKICVSLSHLPYLPVGSGHHGTVGPPGPPGAPGIQGPQGPVGPAGRTSQGGGGSGYRLEDIKVYLQSESMSVSVIS